MPQGNPRPGELYCHFKQGMYQVLTTALHSETGEKLVVYQALYGMYQTYARPLELFISPVDRQKYPDAVQRYRFQLAEMELSSETKEFMKAELPIKLRNPQGQEEGVAETAGIAEEARTGRAASDTPGTPEEKMMAFLDADTMEDKYKVLLTMRECINDHMINNMAVVQDLVIEDGPLEVRYEELKRCLRTVQKYESTRLR